MGVSISQVAYRIRTCISLNAEGFVYRFISLSKIYNEALKFILGTRELLNQFVFLYSWLNGVIT